MLKDFILDNQWKICVLGTVNWRQSGSTDIFKDSKPLNRLKKKNNNTREQKHSFDGLVKFVQETPKILL